MPVVGQESSAIVCSKEYLPGEFDAYGVWRELSFKMSEHSEQRTPKLTLNLCKSGKDRSKELHFSLKNIAAHSNMSPTVSGCPPVYSPMTDLAMNLCDLSTSWHPGYVNNNYEDSQWQ